MSTLEETRKELKELETLKMVSTALLEVSAIRIKSFKSEFEQNRLFFDEMNDLYNLVKISATKLQYKIPTLNKKENSVYVAITSNSRFYGLLNSEVVRILIGEVSKQPNAQVLIIGSTGKRYIENAEGAIRQSEFLIFKEDYPTPNEMQMFLEKTNSFDRVFVCYPKFVNLFTQEATVVDITHTPEFEKEIADKQIHHIFEPELIHILHFFETQVRKVLFIRIMLEAELSRIAARITKMNVTEERAKEAIRKKEQQLRKVIVNLEDIHLLETFAGSKRWRQ